MLAAAIHIENSTASKDRCSDTCTFLTETQLRQRYGSKYRHRFLIESGGAAADEQPADGGGGPEPEPEPAAEPDWMETGDAARGLRRLVHFPHIALVQRPAACNPL